MSALPSAPNSLSINQVAQEYGGDTPHALSEYYGDGDNVLDGAQGDGGAIPESGAISIGDFFGGRDRVVINLTIGSNTQSYQISQQRGGTYEAGFTDIVLTNNAQVGSTAVGTAGIFTGAAPNYASGDTLKIVNAGNIRGRGGNGGAGANNAGQGVGAGQIAGDAIETTFPVTVVNNSGAKLLGGGGGGGGGARGSTVQPGQPGNPGNPGNPPSQAGGKSQGHSLGNQHSQGNLLPIQQLSSSVVEAVVVVLETKSVLLVAVEVVKDKQVKQVEQILVVVVVIPQDKQIQMVVLVVQ